MRAPRLETKAAAVDEHRDSDLCLHDARRQVRDQLEQLPHRARVVALGGNIGGRAGRVLRDSEPQGVENTLRR